MEQAVRYLGSALPVLHKNHLFRKSFPKEVIYLQKLFLPIAGGAAGAVNGLFGAGGGMVLVPLLGKKAGISEQERFPASIAIIAPICVVSLLLSTSWQLSFRQILPYLMGSALGGVAAGLWGKSIPTVWLHRFLGLLILWGGIRYLW